MGPQGFHYDLDSMFPKEPDFYEDEALSMRDYEYMKRLYPKEVRLAASILEEYLDRYEYEGSPMYAQYPDAVTVYRMAQELAQKLNAGEDPRLKQLLEVMVCQEMYVRRRRHDSFCRKFRRQNIR